FERDGRKLASRLRDSDGAALDSSQTLRSEVVEPRVGRDLSRIGGEQNEEQSLRGVHRPPTKTDIQILSGSGLDYQMPLLLLSAATRGEGGPRLAAVGEGALAAELKCGPPIRTSSV